MGGRILEALDGRPVKWLSLRADVAEQTLSNATRHGSMMSADKAVRIATALGVTVEWLVTGRGSGPLRTPPPLAPATEKQEQRATAKMLAQLVPTGRQGRRMRWPSWSRDEPVLEAVVASHRQAEIDQVIADLRERFGTRAPSRSSLGRFWLRLDEMLKNTRSTG